MATIKNHVRSPKGKTPRQIAKRDANIKAAQERLVRLQAEQKAAREEKIAARQKQAYETAYVESALNGPAKFILTRWLKGRAATFQRLSKFFADRPHMQQPLTPYVNRVA